MRYCKHTYKYGLPLPKSVEAVMHIDTCTGTTIWWDTIDRKHLNVQPTFKILVEDDKPPVGYAFFKCHWIFDIKMDFMHRTTDGDDVLICHLM